MKLFDWRCGLLPLLMCSWTLAQEPAPQVILTGLDNPAGVAVHRKSGQVYVSDSGAGRVLRVMPAANAKAVPVIVDFAIDVYGKGPMYNIGPLGLAFVGQNMLAVGGGDQVDGKELIRFYKLKDGNEPIKADAATFSAGPIPPGDTSIKGEGNFYGLAVNDRSVFITSNGDDTKGWVLKVDVKEGMPGELTGFIATKTVLTTDAPVGITLNKGKLYVGQMGEINVPKDSLLTVYDPKTGKLEKKAETGLFDITGLAFSPKTGKLYALDFAWMDSKQGGLYRLDMEGDNVQATRVLALDKPTALAFGPDGALFITVIGTAEEGSSKKGGQLLMIPSGL